MIGVGVRYKFTSLNSSGSTNVNYNINNYYNNGGGSSTMAKKYTNKGARGVSSGKNFNINGNSNHYYTGNPNSNFSHDPFSNVTSNTCIVNNKNNGVSVKNTKGLLSTRILNKDQYIKSNPVNSFSCYKTINKELIDKYDADIANGKNPSNAGYNKHFRNGQNKDASSKIEKSKCVVDRSNYQQELIDKQPNKNCYFNSKKCNITKDMTALNENSYVVGYDIYLSTLKNKKECSYNPPDAKVIAC